MTARSAWLVEAAASGAVRVRAKMARAVEFAAIVGAAKVDAALGLAAVAGRFADDDLGSILDHLAAGGDTGDVVLADETHSVQPGTAAWERLGTREAGRSQCASPMKTQSWPSRTSR